MPARLANHRKLQSGALRSSRIRSTSSAERLAAVLPPPDSLSPNARIEWMALMPILVTAGTATPADLRAFEMLCEALATESELRATLKREGLTSRTADGGVKSHPAAKMLETARSQAHRLLGDFGLTPRGRQSVEIAPILKTDDPWTEF